MHITIIKKDFIEAIKHNTDGTYWIEYDPKTGKSHITRNKDKKQEDWEIIPIPENKGENAVTRWTPKKYQNWLEMQGFLVNTKFNYDGVFRAPLKRFADAKRIVKKEDNSHESQTISTEQNSSKTHTSPFPCAIVYDSLVLASGQLPLNPATHELVRGEIEDEIDMCLVNMNFSLESAGSSIKKVLKVVAYLTDIKGYKYFEDIWEEQFPNNPPAFSCVEVSNLPYNVKVVLDAVAYA